MCGILGIYDFKNSIKDEHVVKFNKALLKMQHRGPDAQNSKSFENKLLLGHVRLSIIDLSESNNQPFTDDERFWIVFNGEIFNYLELRGELINEGCTFMTSGDTEVLLKAYQKWGTDCVSKFNGMWAFAIYDKLKDVLFCSRDRFGIKPFNYSFFQDSFIFSSEIKSIVEYYPALKEPNYNVIANFCRTSIGAQTKETWFKNIFRLEPAHNLLISQGKIESYRYWDYPKKIDKEITFEKAVEYYSNLFKDAVNLRMRSDVPVGFTLSSGIDSSSLVSFLKENFGNNTNTYTASFSKNNYDESEKLQNFSKSVEIDEPFFVRKLTKDLGLKSNFIEIDYQNYIKDLSKLIYHLESGHGSPAVYPLAQVLERASKDVIVILEGQGADELLGGYISNVLPVYLIDLLKKGKFLKAYREYRSFVQNYSLKKSLILFIRQSNLSALKYLYFKFSGKNKLFEGNIKNYKEIQDNPYSPIDFDDDLNKHLYKAHTGGLVNLLHYGDAISMAYSLESRLPFMDYRLVEFVFTLPSHFKIRNSLGKYIHRVAMEKIVPDYILNNPFKFGFDSPLAHIFKGNGENTPKGILLSKKSLNRGLFSEYELKKMFHNLSIGKKDESRTLYRLLSVELWFRKFIDDIH